MKRNEQRNLYSSDVVIVKNYKVKNKIILLRYLREAGFETEKKYTQKATVNEEKLDTNISRARSAIFELAYCNPWELFITLTIDQKKYNRHDLKKYYRDFSKWLQNYNRIHGTSIKYIFIPERHKDGSWHMHGLIMGLPLEQLQMNAYGYLDWIEYKEKFGYCSIDKIRNHEAVSKYITKYISKDLGDCVKELNAKMYYCSKGLERSTIIAKGTLSANNVPTWDYQNDWVKVKWIDSSTSVNDYITEAGF